MYEKLVKELRDADEISMCSECGYRGDKKGPLFAKAADAIERLSREVKSLYKLLGTHPDPKGEKGERGVPLPEPPKEEA